MTIVHHRWSPLVAVCFLALCAQLVAQDAPVRRLRLSRDTVLAGVSCAATGRAYAELYANGGLIECPVAADTTIAGHTFARGTWIRLHQDRGLDGAWLVRDTELQGLPCKGTGYKGWSVRFHADGRLALCSLSRDATIEGVPCRAGAFLTELSGSTQVQLHPNGRLRSCRLAREFTRNGVTKKRGQRIVLNETGELIKER
jgi:hypothetical protein